MGQTQQVSRAGRSERRAGQDQDTLPRLGQAIFKRAGHGLVGHLLQRIGLIAQATSLRVALAVVAVAIGSVIFLANALRQPEPAVVA